MPTCGQGERAMCDTDIADRRKRDLERYHRRTAERRACASSAGSGPLRPTAPSASRAPRSSGPATSRATTAAPPSASRRVCARSAGRRRPSPGAASAGRVLRRTPPPAGRGTRGCGPPACRAATPRRRASPSGGAGSARSPSAAPRASARSAARRRPRRGAPCANPAARRSVRPRGPATRRAGPRASSTAGATSRPGAASGARKAPDAARRSQGLCGGCGGADPRRRLALRTVRGARDRAPLAGEEERRRAQALREAQGEGPLHRLRRALAGGGPVRALRTPLVSPLAALPRAPALPAAVHRRRALQRRGPRHLRQLGRGGPVSHLRAALARRGRGPDRPVPDGDDDRNLGMSPHRCGRTTAALAAAGAERPAGRGPAGRGRPCAIARRGPCRRPCLHTPPPPEEPR